MPAHKNASLQKRDPTGRFLPGTAGGPGRIPLVQEQRYLIRLHERVTLEDWNVIVDKALEQAKGGNYRARNWLSDYCLGKPQAEVNIDSRSVQFNLANLTPEQLAAAIELAKLVNAPGGAGAERP